MTGNALRRDRGRKSPGRFGGASQGSARTQCRRECSCNAPLEQVTGEVAHLALDDFERLPLALTDLDREQLEQVTVAVRRRGAGTLGPIEQSVRDVEADRTRTGRRARR